MFEHPDPNQYELGKDSFDPEGKLSYQNLRQVLLNPCDRIKFNSNETHDTYMASIGMGTPWAKYNFYVARINEIPPIETPIHKELKIHVSLKEEEWSRTLGWNIVKYVLGSKRVGSFKVIRPEYNMSDDPEQRGKDITIYAGYNRHLNVTSWLYILQKITITFVANGVKPGYRQQSTTEKPEEIIKGSKYFSYRYYDEIQKKSLPFPKPDPIEAIDLSCLVQPYEHQKYDRPASHDLSIMHLWNHKSL